MQWNPRQYLRYEDARGRPFVDLLARVGASEPREIVDLGCGPGNLTALLAERWPSATTTGIDSSADMISAARESGASGISFAVGDVREFTPSARTDLVISNAVLQWVPDHLDLLARWADALTPGGWLAWQVPDNFGEPSHGLMRELAQSPTWRDKLAGVLRHGDAVAAPSVYAELLLEAGLEADVWQTTYLHILSGPDPVLEWVRGTGLRPVLAALSPDDGARFEATYRDQLRAAYPAEPGGTVFPFRRTFCVGHKPA